MRMFERYCDDIENIENYEKAKADNFVGWDCHHRLETHTSDGEKRLICITIKELKALDMYWHRPANELIFLTVKKHMSLHKRGMKGKTGGHLSEETKKKISEALKGKPSGHKGKHRSEETKRKMSESKKGKHWKLVDEKRIWY